MRHDHESIDRPVGPLDGVLIVDLSRVLAGPYCTLVLADLGARVIKVEKPEGGDDARAFPPFVEGGSAYFLSLNRGKQSIALDLKDSPDRHIFEALLERADVLVENFRPGALDRLGYGWETLHASYPRLIYASTSGFGQDGPYATRPAYDMVVQAMGGIMSLTGQPDSPPTRVGTSIGDITAGLFTAVGILSALHHRQASSIGTRVDVSMLDGQVAILENAIARYTATGKAPGPLGSRHPSIAPFEAFVTADGYVVVAAGNDELFEKLCMSAGLPELAKDSRFVDNAGRVKNVEALRTLLESAFSLRTTGEWLEILQAAGIPCGPIQNIAEVLSDSQVNARNMVISAGGIRMAGNPVKISGFNDPKERPAAPLLDASRSEIMAELGLD